MPFRDARLTAECITTLPSRKFWQRELESNQRMASFRGSCLPKLGYPASSGGGKRTRTFGGQIQNLVPFLLATPLYNALVSPRHLFVGVSGGDSNPRSCLHRAEPSHSATETPKHSEGTQPRHGNLRKANHTSSLPHVIALTLWSFRLGKFQMIFQHGSDGGNAKPPYICHTRSSYIYLQPPLPKWPCV